jgi:RNA polymerase sigma-70 factor (ECF subfamily)
MTSWQEFEVADGRTLISDDLVWLQRARQGDEAAWEQLVRRYQQPVFRLAYLILGDGAEAEEVAQDVFVRAYLSLARFDETRPKAASGSPLSPWLLQICRNLARNRRRSLGRYWAAVQRWWLANAETAVTPDKRQEAQLLWQAVRRLRPSAQEIVYLRYFLGLSEAETAVALNVKPGTVKSRLHRALKQLQAVIEQDFPELVIDDE